jgi:hypothetical protein
MTLIGKWGFGDLFNAAKSIVKAAVQVVTTVAVAAVKAVVKVAVTVVAPVIKKAVNVVKGAGSFLGDVGRNIGSGIVKYGDAISLAATVVGIGFCFASVGCGAATIAAVAIGAGIAAAQSYSEHKDWRRAGIQAVVSIGINAIVGRIAKGVSGFLGAGEVGKAAVDLNGAPAEFLGGMGAGDLVDGICDATKGSFC